MYRKVGEESSKTYLDKIASGFFDKYMSGNGLDIGPYGYIEGVQSILASATPVSLDYPGYDGTILPFKTSSQDYVYSSHVLEHISNRAEVIREWHRVVRPGGFIVTVVPHQDLYEKKESLPSKWNGDHKIFYRPSNLLKEFEDALEVNSYRVRHLQDNDSGHDYKQNPQEHSLWCYEIELALEVLK